MQHDGQTLTSHEDKETAIWSYYSTVLGSMEHRLNTLNLDAFYQPPQDISLDMPISENEVWDTIKVMRSDKASGPDGFTRRFYKSCWSIIKQDIMAAIRAVHGGNARQLHLLNSAFIVLIPKKEEATRVGDFRPISLVHSFAKLLTKIMANRLAPKLDEIVSKNQSAFIRGRSIHDNFLLV